MTDCYLQNWLRSVASGMGVQGIHCTHPFEFQNFSSESFVEVLDEEHGNLSQIVEHLKNTIIQMSLVKILPFKFKMSYLYYNFTKRQV